MLVLGIQLDVLLRLVEVLWTLLVTVLGAVNLHAVGTIEGMDDTVLILSFAIVAAASSWLSIIIDLASRFKPAARRPQDIVLLDGFALLFTFGTGVALAERLGVRGDCGTLDEHPYIIHVCRVVQANIYFMWFLCVSFAASTFLSVKEYRGRRGRTEPSLG